MTDSAEATTPSVRRLNHAVLYVRDARKAAAFYHEALGFETVGEFGDGAAVFLRAARTDNHHDLGLFSIGAQARPPEAGRVGLYHLAWQVDTIHDLAAMRDRLMAMKSLVGESDHGVSKSLYAHDVDGNEFEVMWEVPSEHWGDLEHEAVTRRLDLAAELARYG
jgi:catechol-2,3-dioxygenase